MEFVFKFYSAFLKIKVYAIKNFGPFNTRQNRWYTCKSNIQLRNTTISNDNILETLHVIILITTKDGITTLILEACTEIIFKKIFLRSFLEDDKLITLQHKN